MNRTILTILLRHGSMVFVAMALVIGMAQYAAAFIAFPYTFSNGTPADASQVNQNFQAINARQTASRAAMAGTYAVQSVDVRTTPVYVTAHFTDANGTYTLTSDPVAMSCAGLSHGTMTLRADGTMTISTTFADSCVQTPESATIPGTYSVNADGTGTMTLQGGTISFRASRDLSVIMWQHGNLEQGTAMRL